jgi:protein TonB
MRELFTPLIDHCGGRLASSHISDMNLSSTSKLSSNALGYFALTASFVLHVGLIAGFSSWQWVFESPPKNQQKIIKIKVLPGSTTRQSIQKSIPEKTGHFPTTQSLSISSPPIPTLTVRTPKPPTPVFQPESRMKETMAFPKMRFKPRRVQQMSVFNEATKPRTIRLAKTIQQSHSSRQTISVRPSPTLNAVPIESVQPTTPADVRGSNQPRVIQPRIPTRQTRFSKMPTRLSQTALPVETLTHQLNDIQPRSVPTPSQTTASTKTASLAQQAIKTFMSPAESHTKLAAFPKKSTQSSLVDQNASNSNLNAVRGLFTGKVRQRIADAKYYPRTARRRGMEGQPVIAFTLTKEGGLLKANLAQTSGYQLLDQAALEAVQQAVPYPEIPAELKTDTYKFKLPISFVLK